MPTACARTGTVAVTGSKGGVGKSNVALNLSILLSAAGNRVALVDADLANNTLGWQWAGGCGADAAPYFRVFNPVLQGKKFDPDGAYVRMWVPELTRLDTKHIHEPWNAKPAAKGGGH